MSRHRYFPKNGFFQCNSSFFLNLKLSSVFLKWHVLTYEIEIVTFFAVKKKSKEKEQTLAKWDTLQQH